MTHRDSKFRYATPDRAVTDTSVHDAPALSGRKWRSAISTLALAPLRLHRYRNFHTEVVEDAIRAFDGRRCT